MSTWNRLRVAFKYYIGMAVAGIIYTQVFSQELLPLVPMDSQFATPVVWLDRIAPIVIGVITLAVTVWVVAGAVQDERTVDRRRVRR